MPRPRETLRTAELRVNISPDLLAWLRERAEANVRSLAGEVQALLQAMRRGAEGDKRT